MVGRLHGGVVALTLCAMAGPSYGTNDLWVAAESKYVLGLIEYDQEIRDALLDEPIKNIVRTKTGYRVSTCSCSAAILVERKRIERTRPPLIRISLGGSRCKTADH